MDLEESLSLEDDVSVVHDIGEKCIAGKILAPKKLNFTGVNNILSSAWQVKGNFKISNWGDNIFTVVFDREEDAVRILDNGPWTVMGNTVVVQKWNIKKPLNEVCFDYCIFWLQIHNLPVSKRSSENIRRIAELAGRVIEIEKLEATELLIHRFVRVKILVDVRRPLKRGFRLLDEAESYSWVPFKYERLGNFCFACGRLGHEKNFCKELEVVAGEMEGFGIWMRGESVRRRTFSKEVVDDYQQWRKGKVEEGARARQVATARVSDKEMCSDQNTTLILSAKSVDDGTEEAVQGLVGQLSTEGGIGQVLIHKEAMCLSKAGKEFAVSTVLGNTKCSKLDENNVSGPLFVSEGPKFSFCKGSGLPVGKCGSPSWMTNTLSPVDPVITKQDYFVTEPSEGESDTEVSENSPALMNPGLSLGTSTEVGITGRLQSSKSNIHTDSGLASKFHHLSIRKRNSDAVGFDRGGKILRSEEGKLKLYVNEEVNSLEPCFTSKEISKEKDSDIPQGTRVHRRRKWKLEARKTEISRRIADGETLEAAGKLKAQLKNSAQGNMIGISLCPTLHYMIRE
ncbi:hypothetical protein LguiA_033979 [Lonicera macranthoides]